jgi:putative peptide zinc metalloprotease protein
LAERQQQVDRLTLRAPITGVVISRQLTALEGSFVSEGRELLSIGDPTQREFVASIRQDDLLAASDAVERPVTVHLNGRGLVAGRIQRLNPKASITPEFPCLCVPLGGPLPVRALPSEATARDTSSKFELLQPHFRLTVTLDLQAERQPLAGELGWVSLGHQRTCGAELMSWLSHWISDHQRRT